MPPRKPKALAPLPAELAGKKASEPAVVRWVSRNIDNPEPDPATCPDPFAWTLLKLARQDQAFTVFFVEKLWAKLIPSRSQLDQGGPKTIDGKPTMDLIERIQTMRDGAEETAAVASQAVAPPDEFGDFDPEEGT